MSTPLQGRARALPARAAAREPSTARILHVCGRLRPGGITTFVESNLASNDGFSTRHDLLITFADSAGPRGGGHCVHRLDYPARGMLACMSRARSIYRHYDAVAVHGAHPVVVLPLLLSGKRCLIFQHGMSVSSGSAARRLAMKIWHSAVPRLLGASVICSSPYAVWKARHLGVRMPEANVVVIPFGTAMERRRRPPRTRRSDELVVGMVGRLETQKRQDLVLESLRSYGGVHRIRVLIAGDGRERDRLAACVAELPRDRVAVEFLGVVLDMAEFYDRLDLLLFPSAGESLGLAVLEALMRSVPVAVFRDVGGCLPLIVEDRTGFVLDDGVEGLHVLWRRLDADPAVVDRISTRLSLTDLSGLQATRTRAWLDALATGEGEVPADAGSVWSRIGGTHSLPAAGS